MFMAVSKTNVTIQNCQVHLPVNITTYYVANRIGKLTQHVLANNTMKNQKW